MDPSSPSGKPSPRPAPRVAGRWVLVGLALAILAVAGAVALWGRLAPAVPAARERMKDRALPAGLRLL